MHKLLVSSILVAAVTVCIPRPSNAADAGQFTGAQLIKYCNQENFAATRNGEQGPETIGTLICGEYVSGVLQGFKIGQLEMVTEITETADRRFDDLAAKAQLKMTSDERAAFLTDLRMKNGHWLCWPESANGGQLLDIVAKYLQDHPDQLNLNSAILVYNAVHEAFKDKKC